MKKKHLFYTIIALMYVQIRRIIAVQKRGEKNDENFLAKND